MPASSIFDQGREAAKLDRAGLARGPVESAGFLQCDKAKRESVARFELAELPQFSLNDRCWTDESSKTRTIRTKQDRHVASEVDRSNSVGIIVNV